MKSTVLFAQLAVIVYYVSVHNYVGAGVVALVAIACLTK